MLNNILIYCETLKVLNLIVDQAVKSFELQILHENNSDRVEPEPAIDIQETFTEAELNSEPVSGNETAKSEDEPALPVNEVDKNEGNKSFKFNTYLPRIVRIGPAYYPEARKTVQQKMIPSKFVLESIVCKLREFIEPSAAVEKSLMARPGMQVFQMFRIDYFQLFKCFVMVKRHLESRRMNLKLERLTSVSARPLATQMALDNAVVDTEYNRQNDQERVSPVVSESEKKGF